MKKNNKIIVLLLFLMVLAPYTDVEAQCAMCKAAQNSSSGITSRGLNMGILYLMLIPYIAFSVLGYFWYKASKKQKTQNS